jgi:hypothetical protein
MAQDLANAIIERALAVSNEVLLDCEGELKIEICSTEESHDSIVICHDVPLPNIRVRLYNGTKRRCVLSLHDCLNVHTQQPAYEHHRVGNFKVELNNDTVEAIGNSITNLYTRSIEQIRLFEDDEETDLRICLNINHNNKPIYKRSYEFDRDSKSPNFPIVQWLKDLYTILMYFEV